MATLKRNQWVSGVSLCRANLYNHFKNQPRGIASDVVWLDSRQYKRFLRAAKKMRLYCADTPKQHKAHKQA